MCIKVKKKTKSILILFIALIMVLSCFTARVPVRAETTYPFDQTNVLDDLRSSKEFDMIDWPWDPTGTVKSPQIMNFVEWCYSPFKTGDFALYIYFYNPQNLDIDEESYSNRIQMATIYNKGIITRDSTPTDYETFSLSYCNKSELEGYEGLFYKFRIIDKNIDGKMLLEDRVYLDERRYDVSGIVLMQEDGTAKEYTVGGTYYFSGYAAGYGANAEAESTLECTGFKQMETISLKVYDTNYRTESSSLGKYHENEVTSVYFSIPDRYLEQYGNLQRIKAEWWEYKTKEIFIVNNDRYDVYSPMIGVNVGRGVDYFDYSLYIHAGHPNSFAYNTKSDSFQDDEIVDTMYWLFSADDRVVTPAQMRDYVENYTTTYNQGKLPVKNGSISADLFLDTVDEGRTRGYNCKEFDANDDEFNLLSYDANHSGWQKFCDYLWNWSAAPTDSPLNNVSPIEYRNIGSYINYTDENLANNLLINKDDVSDFKAFYKSAESKNETTVLFRFAQTDYYQQPIYENSPEALIPLEGASADVAQTTVFLDFKIIHLTFMDEDAVYTVIPVTQDPIDIYNGLSPTEKSPLGNKEDKFLAWVIFIISIIVGLIVIWLLSLILKAENAIGNPVIKIIVIILTLALAGVGIYFGVAYVINVITGLGGIF